MRGLGCAPRSHRVGETSLVSDEKNGMGELICAARTFVVTLNTGMLNVETCQKERKDSRNLIIPRYYIYSRTCGHML